ncbi:hypothetical protein LY78DRAFT_287580 [Colletotrichum sublineola]|nr:hypothetical protein LY78DRAFT_287580 [Colletotrichum sublineola]
MPNSFAPFKSYITCTATAINGGPCLPFRFHVPFVTLGSLGPGTSALAENGPKKAPRKVHAAREMAMSRFTSLRRRSIELPQRASKSMSNTATVAQPPHSFWSGPVSCSLGSRDESIQNSPISALIKYPLRVPPRDIQCTRSIIQSVVVL